jgi:DNA-binding transcriptional LysR family regulator
MNVNFDLYRVFYIVVKSKSITKAAEKLFITQPAVSQSIKQLEKQLGGKLLFRTPKGIKLTPEGETFFEYIDKGYNFFVSAENKFNKFQTLDSGEIRIGASDTNCKYYLLPYLKKFNQKYPNVKIKVINRTTKDIINSLNYGEVDMGIINLPVKQRQNLNIKEIMSIQDCFVCSKKFYKPDSVKIEDFLKYPILLLEKGSITRKYIDDFFLLKGYNLQPEFELGSIDLLVDFALNGIGVSHVIKDFISKGLLNKSLFEVKLIPNIPKREIGLVTLKNFPLSKASKTFISYLDII